MTSGDMDTCVERLVSAFKASVALVQSIRASEEQRESEIVETPAQIKSRIRSELLLLRALEHGAHVIKEKYSENMIHLGERYRSGDEMALDALFELTIECEYIKRSLQATKNRGTALQHPMELQEQAEKCCRDILTVFRSLHERLLTATDLPSTERIGVSSRRPSSAVLDPTELSRLQQLTVDPQHSTNRKSVDSFVITPPHTPGLMDRPFNDNSPVSAPSDRRSSNSSNFAILNPHNSLAQSLQPHSPPQLRNQQPVQNPLQQQSAQPNFTTNWPLNGPNVSDDAPNDAYRLSSSTSATHPAPSIAAASSEDNTPVPTIRPKTGSSSLALSADSGSIRHSSSKRGGLFKRGKKGKGKELPDGKQSKSAMKTDIELQLPQGPPAESNNYWGFCKGAWTIQNNEPEKAFKLRKHNLTAALRIGYIDCTSCHFTGRHAAPVKGTLPTPDSTIYEARCGIRYRWIFLAKSHKPNKDKHAKQLLPFMIVTDSEFAIDVARRKQEDNRCAVMSLGCLFCCVEDRGGDTFTGVEQLMSHIAEEHGTNSDQPVKEEFREPLNCVIGPLDAEDEATFDIHIPIGKPKEPKYDGKAVELRADRDAVELESADTLRAAQLLAAVRAATSASMPQISNNLQTNNSFSSDDSLASNQPMNSQIGSASQHQNGLPKAIPLDNIVLRVTPDTPPLSETPNSVPVNSTSLMTPTENTPARSSSLRQPAPPPVPLRSASRQVQQPHPFQQSHTRPPSPPPLLPIASNPPYHPHDFDPDDFPTEAPPVPAPRRLPRSPPPSQPAVPPPSPREFRAFRTPFPSSGTAVASTVPQNHLLDRYTQPDDLASVANSGYTLFPQPRQR